MWIKSDIKRGCPYWNANKTTSRRMRVGRRLHLELESKSHRTPGHREIALLHLPFRAHHCLGNRKGHFIPLMKPAIYIGVTYIIGYSEQKKRGPSSVASLPKRPSHGSKPDIRYYDNTHSELQWQVREKQKPKSQNASKNIFGQKLDHS